MYKTFFIIAVMVVGAVEWLKNLLPAKVKENSAALASISGAVSIFAGVAYVFLFEEKTLSNYVTYAGAVLGLVQVAYNTLLQTFKAVVAKLKSKTSVVSEDEIIDAVTDKVTEKLAN